MSLSSIDQQPGAQLPVPVPTLHAAPLPRRARGSTAFIRRSRRGSFLVLVIGVLALISAFMVIYVAVGRADQQLSSAVQRGSIGLADAPDGRAGESSRDAVGEKFARYAAQVIADDALATFYVNKTQPAVRPDGQPLAFINLTREASDAPYTDWNRDSQAPRSEPDAYFSPVGTYDPALEQKYLGALPETWKPSDPWLASTEPVWLNYDAIDDPPNAAEEYLLRRDWAHISNLAPDGAFVNLWNMRGTTASYVGNFEARPDEMRQNLRLTDPDGAPTNTTDFGVAANPDAPAYWTMRQRGAAVPVGAMDGSPAAMTYRPYQWADADGDGIYDSRWFEMVDPRQEDAAPDYDHPQDVLGIANDRLRYFFAARVVDLSALANVNIHTDFVSPPDSGGNYPPGLTPADVDLRRLLTLQDVWLEFPFADNALRLSYDKLAQSSATEDGRPQNYLGYTNDPSPLTTLLGNRAYLGMGYTIDRGTVPVFKEINKPADKPRFGKNDDNNAAQKRAEYFEAMGSSTDGVVHDNLKATIKSPFGPTDLLELLTYRGVNDPSYTSTLESATGAKYEGPVADKDDPAYTRFNPLRDNRPLEVERLDATDGNFTSQRQEEIYAHLAADVRQRLTTLSGARPIRAAEIPVVLDTVTNQYKVSADELVASELRTVATAGASGLVNAYVNGLLPHASDPRVWPTDGNYPAYRFLNYGYRRPEVGLRMAAQLAVNLQSLRDGTISDPPVLTVALWDQFKDNLDADKPAALPLPWQNRAHKWSYWPYEKNKGSIADHRLSQSKADAAGDELCADAVNVIGVTPQPVITAAASFIVFTDAKQTPDEGDKPYQDGYPAGAPDVQINGDRSTANADYLGEVFAVQIVNPFPRSITLGSVIKGTPGDSDPKQAAAWLKTRNRFDYYIEYAGRFYRLAGWLNGPTYTKEVDSGPITLTLGPSESRVFYFTSIPLEDMEQRFRDSIDTDDGGVAIPNTSDPAGFVRQWIKTQLGGAGLAGEPVYVEPFDPTKKGEPVTTTSLIDITAVDTTLTPAGSNKVVRLWRAYRDPWEEDLGAQNELWDDDDTTGTYGDVPDQNIENDILIDRLRDPDTGQNTWRHEPPTGLSDVKGAKGWDWDSDPKKLLNKQNYNRPSGMSFTFAALVARRADPRGVQIEKTGMLPAYCIESAFGSTHLSNTAVRNYEGTADFTAALAKDDLCGARILYREEKSIFGDDDSWYGNQVVGLPLFNVMGNAPSQWTVLPSTASDAELMTGAAEIPGVPSGPMGTQPFDNVRPMMWADLASTRLRAADVLLPLAVGAQYSHRMGESAPSNADELDDRWLTLAESWALALNFESANSNLAASPRWKLYDQFGELDRAATPPVYPATDRGRVVIAPSYDNPASPTPTTQTLSAFVPFVDQDGDGYFDRGGSPREDLSLGITPAMAIIDQFNAVNTAATLTKPTLGTVNLATAPLAVLRILPMLSPTSEDYFGGTGGYSWWWKGQAGNNTQLTPAADLAATIFAYRDKGWMRQRPDPASASTAGGFVNFDDRDASGNLLGDVTDDADLNGRSGRTDIAGLREQPGLLVPSEILAATRRYQLPYSTGSLVPANDDSNIDFMGWDVGSLYSTGSRMNGQADKGITSLDYSDFTTIKNDYEVYEDKLIVANGVLNTAATRSDYFAVWFVVSGFRSTDVRGLGLTTPMVPSVQRRYVMVVDRSQVVKKGDKARIVFFREVPM